MWAELHTKIGDKKVNDQIRAEIDGESLIVFSFLLFDFSMIYLRFFFDLSVIFL